MKAGERIDLHRTIEAESFHLGTVTLVRDVDEAPAHGMLHCAWSLFQHGPDKDDFETPAEYEAAVEKFGNGQPDADSLFIAFLAKHYGDTFKEAEGNHQFEFGE